VLALGVAEYIQIDGNPDDIPNRGLRVIEATDSVGCGARDEIRVIKIRINAAVTKAHGIQLQLYKHTQNAIRKGS
jgi:hypothetical protein